MSPTPTHFTIAQTSRPKLQTPPTMHASSPPHHKPTVTDSTSVASPTSCAQVSHLQHPAHKCRISIILRTSAASPTSCTHHCSKPTPQDDGPVIAECVTPQIQGAYCLVIHHKIEQGLSASGPHFAPSQLQRVQLHVWFIAIGMHARERAYKAVMMKMVFEYR